jgi:hypothetical protein
LGKTSISRERIRPMAHKPRVFATCNIGSDALQRLRDRGYEL